MALFKIGKRLQSQTSAPQPLSEIPTPQAPSETSDLQPPSETSDPQPPSEISDPQPPSETSDPPPQIEGFIDILDDERIVGWAWDPAMPERRVVIEVACGERRARAVADRDRADLRVAGKGDGCHGFEVCFDLRGIGPVEVRDAATGAKLPGSPLCFDPLHLLGLPGNRRARALLRAEAEHARLALGEPDEGAEPVRPGYATRARLETLLATDASEYEPVHLVTRYLAYRAELAHRPVPPGDPAGSLAALQRYLAAEGHRPGGLPLSPPQIAFLNAPMPRFGLAPEVSVAAYNAIVEARPEASDFADPAALREALFWWCTEGAPALAPDGSLITEAQVRLLTRGATPNASYPLNDFLRTYLSRDPALAPVTGGGMLERALALCILILRCARAPALARFLPAAATAEILAPAGTDAGSRFEALLALALEGGPEPAQALSRQLTESLAAQGLALASPRPPAGHPGTAPALARDPRISSGLEPGIAVIGPVRAASGIGQATRQSLAALRAAGRHPAILDYRGDFPSPLGGPDMATPELRRPRTINLVHLNADTLPLALAEIDARVFARSYNIGYVFWELDQVPRAHRLGLDLLDEVWVASAYNRAIYEDACDVPVHDVGLAVEPLPETIPGSRAAYGLPETGFVYLATFDAFSFIERKNPLGLVRAFLAAFPKGSPEPVHLVLKTQNRTSVDDPHQVGLWRTIDALIARDPRIRIIDRTLPYIDLLGLKQACDAYVSLHRSEGLGIGMIEAMQLKRPVIATAYSGNLAFCTPETAFLVDYTLVPVRPEAYIAVEPGSRWAEPSLPSAAAAMRAVYENPAEAQARAEAAAQQVARAFSPAAIGRRYAARLDAIEAQLGA
jgi:glycosyltransferase involved in cell wall biosynthesis